MTAMPRMTARDMARFGLLYLRKGNWNGRQIIPPEWIERSTKAYSMVNEELGVGYGYMWNVVLPDHKLVYVYRYDTDGDYQDPGEATIQLVSMIMNSRLAK